jgi:hypothetical protein
MYIPYVIYFCSCHCNSIRFAVEESALRHRDERHASGESEWDKARWKAVIEGSGSSDNDDDEVRRERVIFLVHCMTGYFTKFNDILMIISLAPSWRQRRRRGGRRAW